jgi:hypothetical protein
MFRWCSDGTAHVGHISCAGSWSSVRNRQRCWPIHSCMSDERDAERMCAWIRIVDDNLRIIMAFESKHLRSKGKSEAEPLADGTHARWTAMWDEIWCMFDVFEEDYSGPTDIDKRLAALLADRSRTHFGKVRRDMETKYPGLPADRAELELPETLFTHLIDDAAPSRGELTDLEKYALAHTSLDRAEFMAARSRLRQLVDKLPGAWRMRALTQIDENRCRRN